MNQFHDIGDTDLLVSAVISEIVFDGCFSSNRDHHQMNAFYIVFLLNFITFLFCFVFFHSVFVSVSYICHYYQNSFKCCRYTVAHLPNIEIDMSNALSFQCIYLYILHICLFHSTNERKKQTIHYPANQRKFEKNADNNHFNCMCDDDDSETTTTIPTVQMRICRTLLPFFNWLICCSPFSSAKFCSIWR